MFYKPFEKERTMHVQVTMSCKTHSKHVQVIQSHQTSIISHLPSPPPHRCRQNDGALRSPQMRKSPTPSKSAPSSSCLLQSLHHCISHNLLPAAVSTLPILSRAGLRPPLPLLSLLLSKCLSSRSLQLARQLLLFLHVTSLKPLLPSSPPLSHLLLRLHFLLRRPDLARSLFLKIPAKSTLTYNLMLAGYSRLRMLPTALRLFHQTPSPDVVSFNTLILASARAGQWRRAVSLYSELRRLPICYNDFTFSALAMACVKSSDLGLTQQVHSQILALGLFPSNVVVCTSLVDAYAKAGSMEGARRAFDEMLVRDVVGWTALVHGYAKIGELEEAQRLFDEMPERNSISWTALIGGYARFGRCFDALDLLRRMVGEGVEPDQFTFSSGLCACAAVAMRKHGQEIHGRLLRVGFRANAIVMSSLVDMYSKCGDLRRGRRVFRGVEVGKRDTIMWNTMMSAEGQHGNGREAIRLFEEMVEVGTKPDGNTFVVLLTACSHSGLVGEGLHFFESMEKRYKIKPEEDHYSCLVDIFGRSGKLEEAVGWVSKMQVGSSCGQRAWSVLLGACRTHKNAELGKAVAEQLIELDPKNSASYVLLSNIYAEGRNWESVKKVRSLMEEKRVRKEHGESWIEVDNVVHSFGAWTQLHPRKDCIYDMLEQLLSQMGNRSIGT